MQLKKIFSLCLISILCLTTMVFGDSLPIKDGRYDGGTVIIIKLTEKQKKHIKAKYKPYMEMSLTKSQQAYIANKAKVKEPPTKLIVVRPVDTQGECTCGLANIGLIIDEGNIEIPVDYLATDKEAEEMKIID